MQTCVWQSPKCVDFSQLVISCRKQSSVSPASLSLNPLPSLPPFLLSSPSHLSSFLLPSPLPPCIPLSYAPVFLDEIRVSSHRSSDWLCVALHGMMHGMALTDQSSWCMEAEFPSLPNCKPWPGAIWMCYSAILI